ncbi:MAG: M61 family metallopeptidase, partial [Planctomycetota bacterium]
MLLRSRAGILIGILMVQALLGALVIASAPAAAAGEPSAPVGYTLRFPAPHTHYVDIEARYATGGAPSIELMMAVWTPGSYLIREYARHVEDLRCEGPDGAPLSFDKVRKNRWRIDTGGHAAVTLRYRVYCREMSVRTNFVEAAFAVLNGAPTFITRLGALDRAHEVRIVLPEGWEKSLTGLPPHPGGAPHHYLAPDFDTLVDCPIVLGNPAVHEFEVGGKKHLLVNEGEGGIWDGPRSAADVEKIVAEHLRFWGQLPYERYTFLNLITEGGGGLEHKNSTLLLTSRWRSRNEERYRGWLGLVSHEFFHTWNVKRLRPVELGPFDYEREVTTRSLWIAEGLTSYYDDLLLERAGLLTRKQYLKALSGQIEGLQTTPGRKVHALEMTSYDSWIKFYRGDENSPNSTISYYTKGAVVGFLLDAAIRRATAGERSLDDVMRLAYERYSGARGYTPEEFRATAAEVAGIDLGEWFRHALEGTGELSYDEALAWYGLRFRDPQKKEKKEKDEGEQEDEAEKEEDEKPKPGWLGLRTRSDG